MTIPNGRYTFYLQGETFSVRVNSGPARKRWTKLELWVGNRAIIGKGEWFEVTNVDNKRTILAKLKDPNTDLLTASALYTRTHGKCGICGNDCVNESRHDECMSQAFGKEKVNDR